MTPVGRACHGGHGPPPPPPPVRGGVHALPLHGAVRDWLGVSHPSLFWAFPLLQMAAITCGAGACGRGMWPAFTHHSLTPSCHPRSRWQKTAAGVRPASLVGGGCCRLVCNVTCLWHWSVSSAGQSARVPRMTSRPHVVTSTSFHRGWQCCQIDDNVMLRHTRP